MTLYTFNSRAPDAKSLANEIRMRKSGGFFSSFFSSTVNNVEWKKLTEHQVHGTEDERQFETLPGVDLVARDDIAETYSWQRDEAEVRTIQLVPVFPFRKQNRAAPDIPVEKAEEKRTSSQSSAIFPGDLSRFSRISEFNRGTLAQTDHRAMSIWRNVKKYITPQDFDLNRQEFNNLKANSFITLIKLN